MIRTVAFIRCLLLGIEKKKETLGREEKILVLQVEHI
jgi:hypothetical protein